jgi:uncharacterized protein YydD (DUF2326 family)
MKDRLKYENFFLWLITPQNDEEARIFKEEGFVDDYIDAVNRIPLMSDEELIDEINHQLEPYKKCIDKNEVL